MTLSSASDTVFGDASTSVKACEFGTLRFFAKSDFQNGRPTEVVQRASLKELSALVSSCIRLIQPDVCVCGFNLREIQFRQYHFFSSVFHDPLLRCTCTDLFRFFDFSMLSFDKCGLWEQQGFFFFQIHQAARMRFGFPHWHAVEQSHTPSTRP